MHNRVAHAWRQRGALSWVLLPLSWVYAALVALRRTLYQAGVLSCERVDAAVLVVGNVIAGGAGKTPTTAAIVSHLQRQNLRMGIVSRGYGRRTSGCLEVLPNSPVQDVGDEALLLRRATGAPVFVAAKRVDAARALLERYPQTDVIVCDDGLQHYNLFRDLEVCVFDDRGVGNGWMLPAGPLREPWPRVAVPRAGQDNQRLLVLHSASPPAFAGHTARRNLASVAVRQDGTTVPLESLQTPGALPLAAVAGVARPEAFFAMLRAASIPVQHTVALPDHYAFDHLPAEIGQGYRLICTEKDAAKLWPLAPDALAVGLVLEIDGAFFAELDARLAEVLAAKLSSKHGHKTT